MKQAGLRARRSACRISRVALLDEANKLSPEPLVCNQIECHPFLDQRKVIAACRRHGMAVIAYSPIARGGAQGDDVLARIGKAHGKSAAQVCLRYLVQQDIVVIPRTSKIERLEENFALFDFALTDARDGRDRRRLSSRDGRSSTGPGRRSGIEGKRAWRTRPRRNAPWSCSPAGRTPPSASPGRLQRFARVETVGFDYGQRHAVELDMRPRLRERSPRSSRSGKRGSATTI